MKIGIDLAYKIGAEILVFVDSYLRSITPEWIALLGKATEKVDMLHLTIFMTDLMQQ